MAEQWHGMTVALGSIPGGSTFLSCSFAISEVFGCNGMIQRSLIISILNWSLDQNNWSPNQQTQCDSAQILNDQV